MEKYSVKDRYRLIGKIGEGGFGEVIKVFDTHRQTLAAMKLIDLEKAGGKESFERERMVLSAQTERFFPVLFDSFTDGGMGILVMEFLEGSSLKELVEREGPLSPERAAAFLEQVGRMLAFLHGLHPRVFYLDLKPDNLILEPSGRLRLLDFGSVRTPEGEGFSLDLDRGERGFFGTPGYSAPEVWQPDPSNPPNTWSDIYSLGALLFYLLSGVSPDKPPYQVMDLKDFAPGLAPGYGELIRKAVEKDPGKRFLEVSEFMRALGRAGRKRGLFSFGSFGRHLRILENVWKTEKLFPGLYLLGFLLIAFPFPLRVQGTEERVYRTERILNAAGSAEASASADGNRTKRIINADASAEASASAEGNRTEQIPDASVSAEVKKAADAEKQHAGRESAAADHEMPAEPPEITLMDESGRKLLLREGSIYPLDGDLHLLLSGRGLLPGKAYKITLSLADGETVSRQEYLVRAKD